MFNKRFFLSIHATIVMASVFKVHGTFIPHLQTDEVGINNSFLQQEQAVATQGTQQDVQEGMTFREVPLSQVYVLPGGPLFADSNIPQWESLNSYLSKSDPGGGLPAVDNINNISDIASPSTSSPQEEAMQPEHNISSKKRKRSSEQARKDNTPIKKKKRRVGPYQIKIEENINDIKKMWNNTYPKGEIIKKYGLSRKSLDNYIKNHPNEFPDRKSNLQKIEENIDDIKKMWNKKDDAGNNTYKKREIIKKYALSRGSLDKYIKNHSQEFPARNKGGGSAKKNNYLQKIEENKDEIKEMWNKKDDAGNNTYTPQQIISEFSISTRSFSKYRKNHPNEFPDRKSKLQKIEENIDDIKKMWIDPDDAGNNTYKKREIIKKYGLSRRSLDKYIKNHSQEFPARNKGRKVTRKDNTPMKKKIKRVGHYQIKIEENINDIKKMWNDTDDAGNNTYKKEEIIKKYGLSRGSLDKYIKNHSQEFPARNKGRTGARKNNHIKKIKANIDKIKEMWNKEDETGRWTFNSKDIAKEFNVTVSSWERYRRNNRVDFSKRIKGRQGANFSVVAGHTESITNNPPNNGNNILEEGDVVNGQGISPAPEEYTRLLPRDIPPLDIAFREGDRTGWDQKDRNIPGKIEENAEVKFFEDTNSFKTLTSGLVLEGEQGSLTEYQRSLDLPYYTLQDFYEEEPEEMKEIMVLLQKDESEEDRTEENAEVNFFEDPESFETLTFGPVLEWD